MKKLFILPFIFLLFLSPVFAANFFNHIAGVNQTFLGQNNVFSSSNVGITSRSLLPFSTMVDDLNNDGVNEIITVDITDADTQNWVLNAYDGKSLTPIDSINMNLTASATPSNIIIADLDDDGTKEIYYFDFRYVKSITFNSSNEFTLNSFQTRTASTHDIAKINCDNTVNTCFVITSKQDFPDQNIAFFAFNNTDISDNSVLLTNDAGINDGKCGSNIRNVPVGNFNPNNGDRIEVVESYMVVDGGVEGCMVVGSVDVTNMSDITADEDNCQSTTAAFTDASPNCFSEFYSFYISPPLVMEFNGFESDGKEVIVGVTNDESSYKVFSWKIDGTFIDDFPEIGSADGRFISSPFQANAMATSGYNEFCMIGFNSDDGTDNEMLCGSKINTAVLLWFLSTESIELTIPTTTNITPSLYNTPNIVFGIENINGGGLTELLSTHGIHTLADPLVEIYATTFGNSWVLPVDAENVGFDDVIAGTTLNLRYLDDGFTNSNCEDDGCIQTVQFNPCISSPILLDETVQVSPTVADLDGDDVNMRVHFYNGLPNEVNTSWSANVSSGTTLSFTFDANVTITNGEILIEARDVENLAKVEQQTVFFTVAASGSRYGETVCTDIFVSTPEEDANLTLTNRASNPIQKAVTDAGAIIGLGTKITYLMFILLIMTSIFIVSSHHKIDNRYTVGVMAIVGVMMVVIGAELGLVGIEVIILIASIIILIGVIFVATLMAGSSSGV